VLVAPGDTVRAGALLVQLDPPEIQSRLDQAIPVFRNAEIELKRFKSLLEQRAVSQQELDAIEARLRVAQATVTEAETMLGYTKITAPFAGVITRKLSDVGDLAIPGRALLEIEDPRVLRVEADIPESLIDRVQLGAKLHVSLASATQSIEAVVSEIAPAADSATRTFLVKLDLPEQTGLRAGRFARLTVPLGESHALRIPASAVVQRGQMELAFVADADRAHLRLVKTGKRLGDEVEIVSGLAAGDRVIVEGAEQLRDGQPIQAKP
jgi:RND family efflux transporter MFP subunit